MLARLYIEALLTDSKLADQVWALWNARLISDDLAAMAWCIIATDRSGQPLKKSDEISHLPYSGVQIED